MNVSDLLLVYTIRDQSYQRALKQLTDLLPKDAKPIDNNEPVNDYV